MHVVFPWLLRFGDASLLLLRFMIAGVFFASGWSHLRHPTERAKSIDATREFTIVLGVGEVLGSAGVALGILTQVAALGLIAIGLGAIQKKIFVWKTGFWGPTGYGWHYDLMLLLMNLVVLATDGGKFVLF